MKKKSKLLHNISIVDCNQSVLHKLNENQHDFLFILFFAKKKQQHVFFISCQKRTQIYIIITNCVQGWHEGLISGQELEFHRRFCQRLLIFQPRKSLRSPALSLCISQQNNLQYITKKLWNKTYK